MAENDFHETPNMYSNLSATQLSDQQQFRRNKINKIKDSFVAEIKERVLMSKRLSKYIPSFGYFDKPLTVSFVATGSISIASFAPVGMASTSFSLAFSISTGIVKNLKKQQEIRKKDDKVVMLARSKLNTIKSKISEVLINNEISSEDFVAIINEEKNMDN